MRKEKQSGQFLWVSVVVLLVAAVMRIVMLQGIPLGLARDEVRNAEIVSFIRQGEHALFFRAGFGHEPLYHYWSVPFQVLLGENVLSVRLPSVFLGLLLIALVLRWAKRDFGELTAIIAGFGLALGWMPIVFSRLGIRAIMEPVFLVGMAWFWHKRPLLAGILLGLSLYTYTAARVVFLIPLGYMFIQAIVWKLETRKQTVGVVSLSARLKPPIIILVTAVVLYLPLFFTLRADPSLQERMQTLAGPLTALQYGDIRPIFETTLQTLGAFTFTGMPSWTYTVEWLPLFNGIALLFFYTGFLIMLWRIRLPQYTLIFVWLGVGILPSAAAPNIIRMIGALPIIYLLPGIALATFCQRFQSTKVRLILSYGLAVFYLISLTAFTIKNNFIDWSQSEVTRDKYQTVLQEMGAHWQANAVDMMVVVDDFYEPIERESLRYNMAEDVGSRWVQVNPPAAGALVLPGEGTGLLYVPEVAPLSQDLMTAAGVVPEDLVYRHEKRPSFAVYNLPEAFEVHSAFSPVLFDEKITLLGYHIEESGENNQTLFTIWQVEGELPWDLTAFVHLVAADGSLIAQHDGFDVVPTTLQAGDVVIQRHILPLSIPLPENSFLQTGLYLHESGGRLTHGGELGDRAILREE